MSKYLLPLLLAACSPLQFGGKETIRISAPPCNYAKLSNLPQDDSVPEQYRENVSFIKDVRRFGIEHLGLYWCTEHYTTFRKDEEAKTLYRLFVAKPRVLLDTWEEATVFFKNHAVFREDVEAMYFVSHVDTLEDEYEYYKQRGYDVYVRNTNNYNPVQTREGVSIVPVFFDYSEEWQAHTVLHEICHDTLEELIGPYFPSELNEPYCALFGYAGAAEYYKARKGVDSKEYLDAMQSFAGYEMESIKVTEGYKQLQRLYKSKKSEIRKEQERQAIFTELKKVMNEDVDNAKLWDKYPYVKNYPLMLKLYNSQKNDLRKTLEVMKDCPQYEGKAIEYIKNKIIE